MNRPDFKSGTEKANVFHFAKRKLRSIIARIVRFNIRKFIWPAYEYLQQKLAVFLYWLFGRCRVWDSYQPAPWIGINSSQRAEATMARWEAVKQELTGVVPGTAIDLGAQVGFFSFKLAELGFQVLAVEKNPDTVKAARLIRRGSGIEGVSFSQMEISSASLSKLHSFDVTVFLSLWHHLCRAEGYENSRNILRSVIDKTDKVCFFETGQSDETYMDWAELLPHMGPDSKEWISNLLIDCGASRVNYLGSYSTFLGPVKRHLFAAWK